jgi:hypothetical protein
MLAHAVQHLSDALAAVRALDDEDGDASGAGPAGTPLDMERVQTLGNAMLQSLARGSFDQQELAALTSALSACVDAERLGLLQSALDDFDFAAARDALQALLDECNETQRKAP